MSYKQVDYLPPYFLKFEFRGPPDPPKNFKLEIRHILFTDCKGRFFLDLNSRLENLVAFEEESDLIIFKKWFMFKTLKNFAR